MKYNTVQAVWCFFCWGHWLSLFLCRHMMNVTWEHNDFSFNSNGYLVNPSMVIITLDRERQWDKVSKTTLCIHISFMCECYCRLHKRLFNIYALQLNCVFLWHLPLHDKKQRWCHTSLVSLYRFVKRARAPVTPINLLMKDHCLTTHTQSTTFLCFTSSHPPPLQNTQNKIHAHIFVRWLYCSVLPHWLVWRLKHKFWAGSVVDTRLEGVPLWWLNKRCLIKHHTPSKQLQAFQS